MRSCIRAASSDNRSEAALGTTREEGEGLISYPGAIPYRDTAWSRNKAAIGSVSFVLLLFIAIVVRGRYFGRSS